MDQKNTRKTRLRERIEDDSAVLENDFEYTYPTPRYLAVEAPEGEACWMYQTDDLHDMARYLDERSEPPDQVKVHDLDLDEELVVCRRVTSFVPKSGGDHFVIVP